MLFSIRVLVTLVFQNPSLILYVWKNKLKAFSLDVWLSKHRYLTSKVWLEDDTQHDKFLGNPPKNGPGRAHSFVGVKMYIHRIITPWKFNIAPENAPFQKESSLPTIFFQGRAVKLREGTWRIIPVSKWLVSPIYKPFSPFGRGTTPVRGLTNHGY